MESIKRIRKLKLGEDEINLRNYKRVCIEGGPGEGKSCIVKSIILDNKVPMTVYDSKGVDVISYAIESDYVKYAFVGCCDKNINTFKRYLDTLYRERVRGTIKEEMLLIIDDVTNSFKDYMINIFKNLEEVGVITIFTTAGNFEYENTLKLRAKDLMPVVSWSDRKSIGSKAIRWFNSIPNQNMLMADLRTIKHKVKSDNLVIPIGHPIDFSKNILPVNVKFTDRNNTIFFMYKDKKRLDEFIQALKISCIELCYKSNLYRMRNSDLVERDKGKCYKQEAVHIYKWDSSELILNYDKVLKGKFGTVHCINMKEDLDKILDIVTTNQISRIEQIKDTKFRYMFKNGVSRLYNAYTLPSYIWNNTEDYEECLY